MNKKFKSGLSLILILFILSSSIPSFAAPTFPDVKATHWAYDYIEKMVKLKMITGYDDGFFKPNDTVNYLENLQLISRLLDLSQEELNAGKMAYGSVLTELKIVNWAQDAVIKSLYRGVISEKELREAQSKGLTTTGTKLRPNRLTISIYLAKAMGLEDLANSKQVISLPYKEAAKIDIKYHKYLAVLIDAKVLDPKGTGEGYFEPTASVKRDAMAKMLSTAYDYLQKNPVKPVEPEKPKEEATIKGTVVSVYSNLNITYVTVKDNSNSETTYVIDNKTKITVDNKAGVVDSIIKGQDIDLTIFKGELTAVTINVKSIEEKINGVIKSVSASTNKIAVDIDRTSKTVELSLDKGANIYVNDKKGVLSDIKAGDSVELVTRNNLVLDIEAKSKTRKIEGFIAAIKENDKKYTVTIEDDKAIKTDYELSDKANIYRSNKVSKITDLRIGDKAYIELEYNVIIDIEAEIVKKDVEGYITGINRRLNKSAEVTIKNKKTEKEETYEIAQNAYIKIDNAIVTSLELKVGYFINATIGGNEIIEIYADSVSNESIIRGKVISVNPNYDEIKISVTSSGLDGMKYGDEVTIRTARNVIISDVRNPKLILNDIRIGMNVYIFGTYDGSTFIANEINIR